jgi:hypothetical protein
MVLLGTIGAFLLVSLSLVVVRAIPVSTEIGEVVEDAGDATASTTVAQKAGPLSDYQVINERPVFNVTRLPVVGEEDDDMSVEDDAIAIKDAPEVKLTGVIITPGVRIASLKPVEGNQENVMAKEGEALTGEYVGWQVSTVNPRNVVLESRDGQKLELELQVHDVKIEEPPKPKPAKTARTAQAEEGRDEPVGEDGQPLSRAEQIRQRIAERREELRREQEEQQNNEENRSQGNGRAQANKSPDYQSAIRAMIRNKPKDNSSNDNEDG